MQVWQMCDFRIFKLTSWAQKCPHIQNTESNQLYKPLLRISASRCGWILFFGPQDSTNVWIKSFFTQSYEVFFWGVFQSAIGRSTSCPYGNELWVTVSLSAVKSAPPSGPQSAASVGLDSPQTSCEVPESARVVKSGRSDSALIMTKCAASFWGLILSLREDIWGKHCFSHCV